MSISRQRLFFWNLNKLMPSISDIWNTSRWAWFCGWNMLVLITCCWFVSLFSLLPNFIWSANVLSRRGKNGLLSLVSFASISFSFKICWICFGSFISLMGIIFKAQSSFVALSRASTTLPWCPSPRILEIWKSVSFLAGSYGTVLAACLLGLLALFMSILMLITFLESFILVGLSESPLLMNTLQF